MKRIFLALSVMLSFIGLKAQGSMELPLNPNVKSGKLANGLSYYILHNEEPKNKANFYIAQKVGSSLETPEQFGLAHFLEHMAFNGTTHYPGKDMLNYLEGKGIRFGADINAYTSFDETVYNINNVPTTDQALMDSVLLVLADWSGSILLEDAEIDAERGVIEGEYIMRNDANSRLMTAILPQMYEEYQYQQMPIGTMEVVKNFPYSAIRDYYKKWYRPDLQGIIIVGDFDAAEMESKVKDLFARIPMPENAAERVYPTISKNEKPKYVTFEDPELQVPRIDTYFKFEKVPLEYRNTLPVYVQEYILSSLVTTMINNRLNEYAQQADCPYSYAAASIGQFLVTRQEGSFTVIVVPKNSYEESYQAAMGIVARACKTGFMGSELERASSELLSTYEKLYKEKDKTDSDALGTELIDHFINNSPTPGIEMEYEIVQGLLQEIPEDIVNQYAASLLHLDNVAVMVTQPTTIELNIPEENAMLTQLSEIINADYEPYVDDKPSLPLISKLPKAGKIKSESSNSELGFKEYMLSNGVKVIVKPTDYANDEILIQMYKPGGKVSYPSSQAADVNGLEMVLEVSKIGPYTPSQLNKYYAGKKVGLVYQLGTFNNYFMGSSTVKDVESLFELLYASFTDVTADQNTFDAIISKLEPMYANQDNNPDYLFRLKRNEVMYPNSPVLYPLSLSTIQQLNYPNMVNMYKESVKNAAEFTLIITGNVDEKTLKPLLTQYVATLPAKKLKNPVKPTQYVTADPVAGKETVSFDIVSKNPAVFVYDCIWQPGVKYDVKTEVMINLFGDILSKVFLETLREEMGGTYSPMARASLNPYTSSWKVEWSITTNEEMKQPIIDRANAEFKKLITEGATLDHFSKARGGALQAYDMQLRSNNNWLSYLLWYGYGYNAVTGHKEALENLTLDEFNKFITTMYNGENQIEVVGTAK